QQRPRAGQEQQQKADGQSGLVVIGRADRDRLIFNRLRDDRENRAPEHREDRREQNPIVEEEPALARDHRIQAVVALQEIQAQEKQRQREEYDNAEEHGEENAD